MWATYVISDFLKVTLKNKFKKINEINFNNIFLFNPVY